MNNVQLYRKYWGISLIIFSVAEMIFFPSIENALACLLFAYAWWLLFRFVFTIHNLNLYFIPTFAITGFILCSYYVPLLATLVEAKPVTYNFQVPIETLFNMALNISTVVLAFHLCTKCYRQNNWLTNIWEKIGYYQAPPTKTVWVIAFVGLALMFIAMITQQGGSHSLDDLDTQTNIKDATIAMFKKYTAIPICLLFGEYLGRKANIAFKSRIFIYLGFVVLIGIGTTKRGVIFEPFASIAMLYLIKVTIENRKIISPKNLFFVIFGVILITGPISDLAMAMSLNRGNMQASGKTFDAVIEIFSDREKLHTMRKVALAQTSNGGNNSISWSEEYVDNILLDRFCNLRVLDASVYYAKQLGYNNPQMHDYLWEEILWSIPTPIVHAMGEKKVAHSTVADVMNNTYFNYHDFWVGWKVTGDIGAGLYLFGYMYYPFALIVYFFTFWFLCTLTRFKNGKLIIPIYVMVAIYSYFQYFGNAYGIYSSIKVILRGWVSVIQYVIMYRVIKLIAK